MTDEADRRVMRLLEERARALSRPVETEEQGRGNEMLVLAVGGELYGVEIGPVVEVQEAGPPTALPAVPEFWAGVINVRGTFYPVLDLGRYLDVEASERGVFVIVRAAGLDVALLVDDVLEARPVDPSDVRRPLVGGPDPRHTAVRGTTADLLSVLDLDVLLSDPKLTIDRQLV